MTTAVSVERRAAYASRFLSISCHRDHKRSRSAPRAARAMNSRDPSARSARTSGGPAGSATTPAPLRHSRFIAHGDEVRPILEITDHDAAVEAGPLSHPATWRVPSARVNVSQPPSVLHRAVSDDFGKISDEVVSAAMGFCVSDVRFGPPSDLCWRQDRRQDRILCPLRPDCRCCDGFRSCLWQRRLSRNQAAAIPIIEALRRPPPMLPANPALPKAKMPPSDAASQ